ncbi:hypothetical protein, partial [Thermoflexus sp.]
MPESEGTPDPSVFEERAPRGEGTFGFTNAQPTTPTPTVRPTPTQQPTVQPTGRFAEIDEAIRPALERALGIRLRLVRVEKYA